MKKYKTIIVEDDIELAHLTADFLNQFEFDCTIVTTVAKAIESITAQDPDLALLDVMLPDGDGIELCRHVRTLSHCKVMMLTARTDVIDQVLGLEMGADDYIGKPIEPRLLLARCRAVLRRENVEVAEEVAAKNDHVLSHADIELDTARREVTVSGKLVNLSTPEYELLLLLMHNKGEVISRDHISKQVRGVEYDGQSRQIDIYVSSVRSKIASKSNPEPIKTVRSKGYIFVG